MESRYNEFLFEWVDLYSSSFRNWYLSLQTTGLQRPCLNARVFTVLRTFNDYLIMANFKTAEEKTSSDFSYVLLALSSLIIQAIERTVSVWKEYWFSFVSVVNIPYLKNTYRLFNGHPLSSNNTTQIGHITAIGSSSSFLSPKIKHSDVVVNMN